LYVINTDRMINQ